MDTVLHFTSVCLLVQQLITLYTKYCTYRYASSKKLRSSQQIEERSNAVVKSRD